MPPILTGKMVTTAIPEAGLHSVDAPGAVSLDPSLLCHGRRYRQEGDLCQVFGATATLAFSIL